MGTHTDAHITGTQEAQREARGKEGGIRSRRRARRAQWKDVAYCFNPWGNGARAATGERLGLIHVTRPLTDGSKS